MGNLAAALSCSNSPPIRLISSATDSGSCTPPQFLHERCGLRVSSSWRKRGWLTTFLLPIAWGRTGSQSSGSEGAGAATGAGAERPAALAAAAMPRNDLLSTQHMDSSGLLATKNYTRKRSRRPFYRHNSGTVIDISSELSVLG